MAPISSDAVGWNLDQLKAHARQSLEAHGGVDRAAFDKLWSLLRYVDGDSEDPTTFDRVRCELGLTQRPQPVLAPVTGDQPTSRRPAWI